VLQPRVVEAATDRGVRDFVDRFLGAPVVATIEAGLADDAAEGPGAVDETLAIDAQQRAVIELHQIGEGLVDAVFPRQNRLDHYFLALRAIISATVKSAEP